MSAGGRRAFLARLAGGAGCVLAGPTPRVAAQGGLPATPARWWTPLPDGATQCGVCPHACRIPAGERGACGTRENRGGRLYTLVHSRPCALAVDPVEKKPFFHVLPGAKALSLATVGCNLECRCCQNWEIAQARPEQVASRSLPPDDVVSLARREGVPLVACTYTEPTVWSEYVLDIAAAGRRSGVRTVVVSNGYIQERPLADVCREIAAYKVDLKGFDPAFYRTHTGGELRHVQDTLLRLRRHGTWVEIVNLVIPTRNDSEAEVRALARFVRDEVGPETPLHFTRFHPSYKMQNLPATPVPTLERCRAAALSEGLRFVYLGNVPGHPAESTTCPGCGQVLVRRSAMAVVENRLKDGACPACRRAIPGIWS